MGFLANTENAQMINGLVEDIREALMDYQVCMSSYSFFFTSLTLVLDFTATRYPQRKLSAHREYHPPPPPFVPAD
jgi:hypothetical protein